MKYGKNLKWFLSEVANAEPDQYETGSIEIIGENEQGQEGSCEIEIDDLMNAACSRIAELETQLKNTQNLLAKYACQTGAGANDPSVHEALLFGDDED